jgi:hypothetical protein
MNSIDSLFICETYKLKPKDSLFILKQFKKTHICNNYQLLKQSNEELNYLQPKQFMLQIDLYNSVETYYFTIFSDKSGHYILDNEKIKHFHSYENCFKYKISKLYLNNYKSYEKLNYFCYQYNYNGEDCENEYINNAYLKGKRTFI